MSKRYYFAIADGCYDLETEKTDETGICVSVYGLELPTDEEYLRDYGEEDHEDE